MNEKKQQFWEFKNSIGTDNSKEATLYIYGDIMMYDMEWWNFPDDVIPHRFKDELKALDDVNTIHVRINSNGGSVFGAYTIMNLLKTHKATIITYIDGIAASAATLIAMAGSKIVAGLGSVMMIHLPSVTVHGNTNDLQKAIEILGVITETMVDVYHAKTKIDKSEIRTLINSDEWMTGLQAKEKGFVDEISDIEVVAHLSDDGQTAFFNDIGIPLKKVRNKDALMALMPVHPKNKSVQTETKKKEATIMNLAELQANHPALYAEVVNTAISQAQNLNTEALASAKEEGRTIGHSEGVTAERERIKAIDARILPGLESLANKAKFETGITAAEYALEVLEAQKEKGINFLNAAKEDAKPLDGVPAAGAPQDNSAEEDALLAHVAEVAKTIKR